MNKCDFMEYFCEVTEKLCASFLNKSQERKGIFSKLFNIQSAEEKLVIEIQVVIEKIMDKKSFPRLSYYDENEFLRTLTEVQNKFKSLIIKNYTSKKLTHREFNQLYSHYEKHANGLVFLMTTLGRKDINLSYIKYYLDCREVGASIPTKYELLKQESLFYLQSYLKLAKNDAIRKLVFATIDSIKDGSEGINQHSNSSQLNFLNLIKFLNTLRLVLIDKNENQLLPKISKVIDRALDIIRPETSYDLKEQKFNFKNDIASNKIISYEKRNKSIRPEGQKIGFFLRKKAKLSLPISTCSATTRLLF